VKAVRVGSAARSDAARRLKRSAGTGNRRDIAAGAVASALVVGNRQFVYKSTSLARKMVILKISFFLNLDTGGSCILDMPKRV
jgi:hypothetical protein